MKIKIKKQRTLEKHLVVKDNDLFTAHVNRSGNMCNFIRCKSYMSSVSDGGKCAVGYTAASGSVDFISGCVISGVVSGNGFFWAYVQVPSSQEREYHVDGGLLSVMIDSDYMKHAIMYSVDKDYKDKFDSDEAKRKAEKLARSQLIDTQLKSLSLNRSAFISNLCAKIKNQFHFSAKFRTRLNSYYRNNGSGRAREKMSAVMENCGFSEFERNVFMTNRDEFLGCLND